MNNLPLRYSRHEFSQDYSQNSQGLPIVYEQQAQRNSLQNQYLTGQHQSRTITSQQNSITYDNKTTEKVNCRIHLQQKATYFLSGQPWIRLCKQCALNKALCGHQIEKQMSHQQFEKKIVLTTLMQQIKNIVSVSETEGKYLGSLADKIDKSYNQSVSSTVKTIDQLLKQLNKIRESIYSIYENNVSKKINQCYQRQGYLVNSNNCLKKHLENIESNFGDMLAEDQDGGQQFTRHINLVRSEIQRARKGVFMDFQKYQLQRTAANIVELFLPKIDDLKKKKLILQGIQLKVPKPQSTACESVQQDPPTSQKKRENKAHERQTYTSRKQQPKEPKYLNCRRKSIQSNLNIDENSEALISIQSHRPSLALRSNSKKHVNNSSMQNSQKKSGLKQSKASLFNSQDKVGDQIFQC